jgi:diguanylate cyclase (GGDEF)-like protein
LSVRLASQLQREHSVRLCALLAELAADPMARDDRAELNRLACKFATGDPLLFVAFFDSDGTLLSSAAPQRRPVDERLLSAPPDRRATPADPILREGRDGAPAYLDVVYPVLPIDASTTSDESAVCLSLPCGPLGFARIGLNITPTVRALSSVNDLAMGAGLVVVLGAFLLSFVMVRHLVLPLHELSRVAGRLAAGDLSARSRVRRDDEMGQLARAFNAMAERVAHREKQIVSMNTQLEERVRQRTRQLREMASRDPLTGLYNRRHFNEVLARAFFEARRYHIPLACLMIDLDEFKSVNDQFGHHVGDEVLMVASATVNGQLRAPDVAARFGGDEFVVLLPHTEGDQAHHLARRIHEKFAADLRERLPRVSLSLSIGIASLGQCGATRPDEFIRAADQALYQAKQRGKNRIVLAGVLV